MVFDENYFPFDKVVANSTTKSASFLEVTDFAGIQKKNMNGSLTSTPSKNKDIPSKNIVFDGGEHTETSQYLTKESSDNLTLSQVATEFGDCTTFVGHNLLPQSAFVQARQ